MATNLANMWRPAAADHPERRVAAQRTVDGTRASGLHAVGHTRRLQAAAHRSVLALLAVEDVVAVLALEGLGEDADRRSECHLLEPACDERGNVQNYQG